MPVIDDFERDTLTYYAGDTAAYTIDTAQAVSGTRSLHSTGANNQRLLTTTEDGLHIPSPGEVVEFELHPAEGQHLRLNLAFDGPTDRLILTIKTDSEDPIFSLQLVENGIWSTVFRKREAIPVGEWLNVRLRWDAGNRRFKGTIRDSLEEVVTTDEGETNNRVPVPETNAFAWETVAGERWVDDFAYTDLGTALGTAQVDHYIGPETIPADPSMHSNPGWGLHFETDKQFDLGTATIYANRQGKTFVELHEFENGEIGELVDSTEIAVSSGYTDLEVNLGISADPGEYLLTRDYDSPIDMSTEGVELAKQNGYAGYDTDSTEYLTLYGSDHPTHGSTSNWYNFHNVQFTVYEETTDAPLDVDEGDHYDADGNPVPNEFEPWGVHTGDVPAADWVRTFHDWFDGGSLNTEKWSIGYPWGRTMAPYLEQVRDSDVWVDAASERLVLRLDRDDEYDMLTSTKTQREQNGWYAGAVNTQETFSQQYGYFEASVKLPVPLSGVVPAYWLRPENGNWPPEIEVATQYQTAKETLHTVHYLDDDGHKRSATAHEGYTDAASSTFRVYGVLWTPDGVWWYRDGEIIDRRTVAGGGRPGQLDRPQSFYAALSAHLWNDPTVGDPRSHSGWPYTWEVDWVQVWEDPSLGTDTTEPLSNHEPLPGADVTLHEK